MQPAILAESMAGKELRALQLNLGRRLTPFRKSVTIITIASPSRLRQ
jgi:hypothetical protein